VLLLKRHVVFEKSQNNMVVIYTNRVEYRFFILTNYIILKELGQKPTIFFFCQIQNIACIGLGQVA